MDTGLDMVRQPSAYLDLLRKFVGKHRQIALRFLVLLDAGRHDNAYQLAHILKGAVGLFGLTGIRSWAGAQEIAIHDGASGEEMIDMIAGIADAGLTAAIVG